MRFDEIDAPGIGPVHAGFYLNATAIVAGLRETPDIVCGHSRGGAVGLLVAALLARAGRPPALVVTFGAPRAGRDLAAALQGVDVRQYRHRGDIVPELPPFPYRHAAPLIEIGRGKSTVDSHALQSYADAL